MRSLTALLVASLVLAACAGPDTTTTTAAPATTRAPATTAAPAATAAPTTATTLPAPPEGELEYTFAAGSEVRFIIDEELRGSPFTVVGTNSNLSGTFTVDTAGPTLLDGGRVVIGAADFVTDSDRRNEAIDRFILQVADHPELLFEIESASPAEVTGSLTIRGVTNPVTFGAKLGGDPASYTFSGSATVDRTLWEIVIPSVPFVANVSEEVTLEFDFVLEPAG